MGKVWDSVRGDENEVLQIRRAELPDPIASVIALHLKPGL